MFHLILTKFELLINTGFFFQIHNYNYIINYCRFGANTCAHPLEVCCKIPDGGVPPEITSPAPPKPTPPTPPPTGGDDNGTAKKHFCGIRNPNGIDFKITGNRDNEAEYGEFPWMLEVIKKRGGSHNAVCGASLLSPNVVLTAAHCVYSYV